MKEIMDEAQQRAQRSELLTKSRRALQDQYNAFSHVLDVLQQLQPDHIEKDTLPDDGHTTFLGLRVPLSAFDGAPSFAPAVFIGRKKLGALERVFRMQPMMLIHVEVTNEQSEPLVDEHYVIDPNQQTVTLDNDKFHNDVLDLTSLFGLRRLGRLADISALIIAKAEKMRVEQTT